VALHALTERICYGKHAAECRSKVDALEAEQAVTDAPTSALIPDDCCGGGDAFPGCADARK
jgi:hypothetical protein